VLLCASKHSLSSSWVDSEIDSAFNKERHLMKERGRKVIALIPLSLDDYLFSGEWKSGKAWNFGQDWQPTLADGKLTMTDSNLELAKVTKALLLNEDARERPPDPRL